MYNVIYNTLYHIVPYCKGVWITEWQLLRFKLFIHLASSSLAMRSNFTLVIQDLDFPKKEVVNLKNIKLRVRRQL